ncbi:tetratricopeptide repeat protein [Aestuariibaculum sediminum]|uniref:Tetratricopeptide repeat protein n=1 Tax=Aestuariibaculum sediminum TaxID=2770637 RepID=A0A8J6QB11_9FLAO|nr:tetratricopeptide repeat protein [Aestuariibaculum sediminum]MBD0832506.1 tetratricopeptide repeat protein [Aestuariibaculum sediminum]
MKTKITFLFALLFVGFAGFAQQDEECMTKLSIFHEYVKAKNYDAAYEPWMAVRNKCPKFNIAIYIDGEKILEDKIDKAQGAEKATLINDLLKLWEQRLEYYPSKTPKGQFLAESCQVQYDNKELLNKTDEELYNCFDAAYKADKETFTNPKSLYTYFSLMVELYDAKKKTPAELFDKYDDVAEKIEEEVKNYSEKLNPIIAKEEEGTPLSGKEPAYKKYYESYLLNYDIVSGGMDKLLGDRANCDNLIPLYEKDFEANKMNITWVRRAVAKMYEKECTDSPLFVKLVNAQHELNPSASSAYYLGVLKDKEGKSSEAVKFYQQAIDLETDSYKKSKIVYQVGTKFKKAGNYGKARNYFRQALQLNPSNGRPYLAIAAMYAASANNCGDTAFNKRAVYWLAADEAAKAGRVDATLKKASAQSVASYKAKAPSRQDVFSCGCSGTVIKIGCWIGASVTVPNI